ncbi:MAG: P63C domain-containing protein [Candidatus Gracilibacteria bacterium]
METEILKAKYEDRPLMIGDMEIPCAVLEDGTRVISQFGVNKALGRPEGGSKDTSRKLPRFFELKALHNLIDDDLAARASNPIIYQGRGGKVNGVPATMLSEICEVWLKARDLGLLQGRQLETAKRAEELMRGFAYVGVIALVDEATGYQDHRVKDALNEILQKFLVEEAKKYKVTFPTQFYKMIFKLNGWAWTPQSAQKKPMVVARWTNDLVYERLAPGLLEELKERNPSDGKKRKHKHFQFLTDDVGEPRLLEHFGGLIALGRIAPNWRKFKELVERAFPKNGTNLMLDLDFEEEPERR